MFVSICFFSTIQKNARSCNSWKQLEFYIIVFVGFLFFSQVPPQVGAAPLMAPHSMMYTQPGLRPTNPFAPVSETQVSGAL